MKPIVTLAALALLAAAGSPAHAAQASIDKINGDIDIQPGQHAGTLSTVNGAIRLEDGAVVGSVHTVNGAIHAGARVTSGEIHTVNGAVHLGPHDTVNGGVEAVNGDLSLEPGTRVSGHVSNVSGRIDIHGARIGAGLETVAGDIHIERGSRIDGGLVVDKPSNGWFHWGHSAPPVVVIGPGAVVNGTLEFRREVRLYVSKDATIGPVKGATPIRFSGGHPQE